jgi:hypothetical protein
LDCGHVEPTIKCSMLMATHTLVTSYGHSWTPSLYDELAGFGYHR